MYDPLKILNPKPISTFHSEPMSYAIISDESLLNTGFVGTLRFALISSAHSGVDNSTL